MAITSLVSCEWLKEQLDKGNPGIRILDGTWSPPAWKRDSEQEYLESHISGAVRFDIADIRDKTTDLPLMLPTPEIFAERVGQMGIGPDTHVVVYDNQAKLGIFSAPRIWWMFRVFGHEKVSVLDGGIPMWINNGYPVVKGPQGQVPAAKFTATFKPDLFRNLEQVKNALETKKEQSADGRPKGRFDGTEPEPNPKLHSGHMIGSINVPFTTLLSEKRKMKLREEIKKEFKSAGIDLDKPVIVSCASSVMGSILALALHQTGKVVPVYDGSWTDWVLNGPANLTHYGVKGEDLQK